ncbi:hypothetical protein ACFYPX_12045 [Micromonospora zamorensis]|uniref:hypothetical protein n=1 Tax=Micromonospora zamorensis TaxID=709883 RepID=UPI0036BD14DB
MTLADFQSILNAGAGQASTLAEFAGGEDWGGWRVQHSDSVLFSAGHGFYQFAVSRSAFDRSLYYNLLLQPALAVPDHYFLQGRWLGEHLDGYPSRDSWIESGLRNGFVVPCFRRESSSLSTLLGLMEKTDRRGFSERATDIAERLDRTPFQSRYWASATNSRSFGIAFMRYMTADDPPILDLRVDPDDFIGFWSRSRVWIDQEIANGLERSSDKIGSDGLLLSQLIQVSGERVLGADCGRISSVEELLKRVRTEVGTIAERDLRAFYTCACELYNRSLADTITTAPGSPHWNYFIAAMDLWRDEILHDEAGPGGVSRPAAEEMDVVIRLPRVSHLRRVSGDVLLAIRRSSACERYFESLAHWRLAPHRHALRGELVEALHNYSAEIRRQVGKDVGFLGLRPQFISSATDVSSVIEKLPGLVQGFLAVGATAATTAATGGQVSPLVPIGLFSLFCLQTVAKYHSPSQSIEAGISNRAGVRIYPDVTISRA